MRAMSHSAARALGLTGHNYVEARLDREPMSKASYHSGHPLFYRQGQSNKDIVMAGIRARGKRGRVVLFG